MTLYYAKGSANSCLGEAEISESLQSVLEAFPTARRVLAVPPDFSRSHSQAGPITCRLHEMIGPKLTDVLPALGTHEPMSDAALERMFPSIPKALFRVHEWRRDIVELGQTPAEFVRWATDGVWDRAWPAETNKLIAGGGHDLILSIGQVVPHEVIGMANYSKNIFVGAGGERGINESHYLSAAYGMERIMGRADNPLRRIMNYAQDNFCNHLPIVYVQSVVGADSTGENVIRGLFVGDDVECFERACALSLQVNFTTLQEAPQKVVVWLDPAEFKSTWLGNKAIYRTRMAIADGGELVILAPGVREFGEDQQIDALIRKYGYLTSAEIQSLVNEREELRGNLSAAAHLIHGSPEGRFNVTYCPGLLSEEEIRSVGYGFGDITAQTARYSPDALKPGWNEVCGERLYFIKNPALGLWAEQSRVDAIALGG